MTKGQFEFKPIQKDPLVVELTKRLLEYIFSGSIQPGDRLPAERELQEALGVGRSAIREALKVLTVLGILEVKHGDGTYLKSAKSGLLLESIEWGLLLGENKVQDIIEVRKEIEVPIVRLAAERAEDGELEELKEILDKLEVSTVDDFVELDIAFHIKIAEMSKNTVFIGILSSIQSLLRTWIKLVIEEEGETQFSYDFHYNIYQALSNKDPEASMHAMATHLDDATGRILDIIKTKKELES